MHTCDAKLAVLAALAPDFSYDNISIVQHRVIRTSVPRDRFARSLKMTMLLKLKEYDHEAQVRSIDEQWLALRAQRNILRIAARRKRSSHSEPSRNVRRRYETATDCSVCQLTLSEGAVSDLPCGHQLHTECLSQMRQNGITLCPTCRADIAPPASPTDSMDSLNQAVDGL